MSDGAIPAAPEKADLAAWLAVFAGTLGAFMAMLDISVVNSALPVIQGEIGATQAEGTWIGTTYLVAEIVVIPLTAWLDRMMGLRRLLLAASILFIGFSMICGMAGDLNSMILGRLGQGLAGGTLIPTAFTIIATRLPPRQQSLGIAVFASASLIGPVLGPLLGGWITENYSWRYAFFMNLPICMGLIALLLLGLPRAKGDWHELRLADWPGITGMAMTLGGLTVLLEEGHREQWFDSSLIRWLAVTVVAGIALVALGQKTSPAPVIRLAILRNRALAASIALVMVSGALLFTSLFAVPQFLAAIAGYNAQQAGQIIFISGAVAIIGTTLYPLFIARVDIRLLVGFAYMVQAFSCYLIINLTAASIGSAFVASQLALGIGLALALIPLQQVVVSVVEPHEAGEASSLFVISRNLGASIGLAAVASFQDQRMDLHRWQIHESLAANSADVQGYVAAQTQAWGGGPEALGAAYRMIDGQVSLDALVMSFNDVFLALGIATLLISPLVLLLRPIDNSRASGAMH